MHTLFTIATSSELLELFGSPEDVAFARENLTPDGEQAELAALWHGRGDEAKAQEHLARIQDPDQRNAAMLSLYEFIQ